MFNRKSSVFSRKSSAFNRRSAAFNTRSSVCNIKIRTCTRKVDPTDPGPPPLASSDLSGLTAAGGQGLRSTVLSATATSPSESLSSRRQHVCRRRSHSTSDNRLSAPACRSSPSSATTRSPEPSPAAAASLWTFRRSTRESNATGRPEMSYLQSERDLSITGMFIQGRQHRPRTRAAALGARRIRNTETRRPLPPPLKTQAIPWSPTSCQWRARLQRFLHSWKIKSWWGPRVC